MNLTDRLAQLREDAPHYPLFGEVAHLRGGIVVGYAEATATTQAALLDAYRLASEPRHDSDADRQQEAVRDALEAFAAVLGLDVE